MSRLEGLAEAATYVVFGFGAIQAGPFLDEACRSGSLGRLLVASLGRTETGVQQLRSWCDGEFDDLEGLLRKEADG